MAQTDTKTQPLLDIRNLKTYFYTDDGVVRAVNGVSLSIDPGKTLGVVGESGCGKSITAFSTMRLIPSPPGKIEDGQILFRESPSADAIDLTQLNAKGPQMRSIRGNDIAMIFQEPMTSLSPVHTIGNQIGEAIMLHQNVDKKEARERSIEALNKVRLPRPDRQVDAYPHELSGGMRQRAMIAMALSCSPNLLIADEPTTALDVTVQAQILDLMQNLQDEIGMAIMLITHDLGVVASMADHVAVMYLGKVVEYSDVRTIFKKPRHPYTKGLLNSLPKIGQKQRLIPIEGSIPDPFEVPSGCTFAPRCPHATDKCKEEPQLLEVETGHQVSCWLEVK
ncbi:MAG: ABC transporter ATP-binding protein [Candidatus Latescibacteria bacterium]|jgi:peptide/nickel transport system ATP-binding protein|nr:ABC transporter ATP-binding protein [Candidatus Latescibacterota bacterium]MBT4138261.1 ABC transporter ATP-binding protein [Candidatus Latescibacterota bacterium]MBT5829230.1 ABC transporter ATP-binding protein [Candidatus Latescibacterota bacterium]